MPGVRPADHAVDVRDHIDVGGAACGRRDQNAAELVKKPAIGAGQCHLTGNAKSRAESAQCSEGGNPAADADGRTEFFRTATPRSARTKAAD